MQKEEELRKYLATVYKLAEMVGAMAGLNVEVKLQKTGNHGFWARGKKFTQVNCEKSGAVVYTGVQKEWAIRAKVVALADGCIKNGYHGRDDELYWRTIVGDDDKLQKTATVLSKICQARLQ